MEMTVFLYFSLFIVEFLKSSFEYEPFNSGELNSMKQNYSQVSCADDSIFTLLHSRMKTND